VHPNPRPLLITGPAGTGKMTAIRAFVAEHNCLQDFKPFATHTDIRTPCVCNNCLKLRQNKSIDVLTIDGTMPVAALREAVAEFWDHTPKELEARYLLIRQAGLATKDTSDALLKLLEEPPSYLQIFLTASDANQLPNAIVSRCQHVKHPWVSPEILPEIVSITPALSVHKKSLGAYPFRSTRQLTTYGRLNLETKFKMLLVDPIMPWTLEAAAKLLYDELATDPDYPAVEARDYALDFLITKYRWFIDSNTAVQPKLGIMLQHLHYAMLSMNNGLFNHIRNPRSGQYINLENQFVGFFLAMLAARTNIGV